MAPVLKRLAWLIACVAAGVLVGAAGSALTGNSAWYLAVPAAIAAGWMFFANPARCDPAAENERNPPPG